VNSDKYGQQLERQWGTRDGISNIENRAVEQKEHLKLAAVSDS